MNNRTTRGANFNRTVPEDVELLAWLDTFGNASDTIKRALRMLRDGAGQVGEPQMTSQKENELLTHIASLEQRLELAERRTAAARPSEYDQFKQDVIEPAHTAAQQAREEGVQLSPAFLAGVRKIAKPGLRLGD